MTRNRQLEVIPEFCSPEKYFIEPIFPRFEQIQCMNFHLRFNSNSKAHKIPMCCENKTTQFPSMNDCLGFGNSIIHQNVRILERIHKMRRELYFPFANNHQMETYSVKMNREFHANDLLSQGDKECGDVFVINNEERECIDDDHGIESDKELELIGTSNARRVALAKSSVAMVLFHEGFTHVQESCVDVLCELMDDFVCRIGKGLVLSRMEKKSNGRGSLMDVNVEVVKRVVSSSGFRGGIGELLSYRDVELERMHSAMLMTEAKVKVKYEKVIAARRRRTMGMEREKVEDVDRKVDEGKEKVVSSGMVIGEEDCFVDNESDDLSTMFKLFGWAQRGQVALNVLPMENVVPVDMNRPVLMYEMALLCSPIQDHDDEGELSMESKFHEVEQNGEQQEQQHGAAAVAESAGNENDAERERDDVVEATEEKGGMDSEVGNDAMEMSVDAKEMKVEHDGAD